MKKMRVPIPKNNAKEIIDLAKKVLDKHLADADATKLKTLNWNQIQPAIQKALTLQQEAERLKTERMQYIQDRNLLVEDLIEAVRNARDILTGTYKRDMKKLGNWGYTVVEAKASRRKSEVDKLGNLGD